ncbi:MAG: DUF177 domain-containing protein [Chloroflexota bacterium]
MFYNRRREILQINVAGQLKSEVGTARTYEVSDCLDVTGEGDESPVEGEVKLTRTDRSILVKGGLSTEVRVACARCLAEFVCPLTLDIEEEYFPTIDIVSGNPVKSEGEPGAFTIDEHHVLDLSEAVRQYALTAVPIKPLCRPDCAGLCPVCGKDLNPGVCNCVRTEIDPRWSKLIELKAKDK